MKSKFVVGKLHDNGCPIVFAYVNVNEAPAVCFACVVFMLDESRVILVHGYAETMQGM